MSLTIETVTEATDELVAALSALLPQLSPALGPTTHEAVTATLAQPGLTLMLARDARGQIVGTASLHQYRLISGRRTYLEDVVVDEAARGQGIGEALTREAIRLARAAGASDLHLTSGMQRVAAHRLYERLGFTRRETGFFRLALTD